jgi:hypothetical protein
MPLAIGSGTERSERTAAANAPSTKNKITGDNSVSSALKAKIPKLIFDF